jgi:phosphatidate cytidylyltransferase
MDEFWFPTLLLMAHLLSGSVWILLISRKGNYGPARDQWIKYLVYLLIVNLIWWGLVLFASGTLWVGVTLMVGALVEWALFFRHERTGWWPSLLFVLILAGFWGSLTLEKNLVLYTYFVVVIFDGTAQVFGQMFGKRPLVQRISPRKTVEGLAGASVVTMAATLLTSKALSIHWTQMIWITPLVMGAALTGDLLASAMKRRMKRETFSHIIPGHGGILDRFDSWLAAGAAVFLIFLLTG